MRVRHLNILRNRLEILIYQNITLASLLTLEKVLLNCTITNCMGTVESRPEPLIDHLRWALSQFQMQFHLSDWRTPFKGWLPTRKDLYLEITLLGALLRAQDMGKLFILLLLCKCNNLSHPIPIYLTICIPVYHTINKEKNKPGINCPKVSHN